MDYFGTILFLVVMVTSSNIICLTLTNSTSITKVAFWCDKPMSNDSKFEVDNFVAKLNSDYNASLLLEIFVLNFSTNHVYETLNSLENYTKDDSAFVVSTLSIKDTWFWSTVLSQKNSVIIDIQNPIPRVESKRKIVLTNLVSLVPPLGERRNILHKILDYMLCKKNITLTSCSNSNQGNLREKLEIAKDQMIFCIVLECLDNLDTIFVIAKPLGMLERRYRWFVFRHIFQVAHFEILPENLISVYLNGFDDFWGNDEVNIPFLSDALTLVAKIEKDFDEKTPPQGYSLKRKCLQAKFMGKTGLVFFNEDNARNGSNYDVFQLVRFSNTTGWLEIGTWRNGSFDTRLTSWIVLEVSKITLPLLRISTKKNKPWVFLTANQEFDLKTSQCVIGIRCINYTTYANEWNNTFEEYCCTGMLVELLQELTERVPFIPILQFVKDRKFGSLDPKTNQWNGMIGEVLRNEADTAMYSLTITERRAKAVEFSYPIIAAGSGILVSVDNEKSYNILNAAFLRPFKPDLWYATIGILCAVIVTLWIAEHLNQQRRYHTLLGDRNKLGIYTVVESMSYSWGVFVQKVVQEGGPRTLGGRVVVGTFGFYIIILLSSYTANLAAIRVVEDEKTEISGIYDDKFMNPTSEFKFTSSKFTATSEFFKQSPDARLNRIYNVMKDRLVSTRAEALALLKSGEIQAFIEDTPGLQYMASQQEDCNLKVVGKSFGNSGYGMPFRPNSSWVKRISAALREMHADGTIIKLTGKWLESACVRKKNVQIAESLGIKDESGNLLLIAVFCVGSFLLLALEIAFKKFYSNFCFTHSWSSSSSYRLTSSRNTSVNY